MAIDRRRFMQLGAVPLLAAGLGATAAPIVGRHRARELGIVIGRMPPGPLNAITDVPGVEVGHSTIVEGNGKLEIGKGPVRTGVTAIWPQRNILQEFLPCGYDAPNGNGELTGILAARHLGILSSPICLTNTSSVGMVYDVLQDMQPKDDLPRGTPVVGETWDGYLNDILGRHVRQEHVDEALRSARGGPVTEGSVGGGTGMIAYDYKGGIGTASRVVVNHQSTFNVGVLVQSNHGSGDLLQIDGMPVGAIINARKKTPSHEQQKSLLTIIATDAPFFAHQLQRLARRATHGIAKTGSISDNASGDFTLAFSTANKISRRAFYDGDGYQMQSIDQFNIQEFLEAVSEAVEEAIINSLFAAEGMTGINDYFVPAFPLDEAIGIMRRYGHLKGATHE